VGGVDHHALGVVADDPDVVVHVEGLPVELWDVDLADGAEVEVAGVTLRALHTPGHAPGAVCFHVPRLGAVFTGDTLFAGGPGATGRSYSDRSVLEESIRARLFPLPDDTVVHTGHGEDTTIGRERENVPG
jgi:glyoxylase-like metal-dependent hydrolase (beta-lactamase superfamily II)